MQMHRTSYCLATPVNTLPLLVGTSAHSFRSFVLLLPAFYDATYYFLERDSCMQAYLVVKAKHYPSWSSIPVIRQLCPLYQDNGLMDLFRRQPTNYSTTPTLIQLSFILNRSPQIFHFYLSLLVAVPSLRISISLFSYIHS
jgi:hypothetical protein